MKKLLSIVLSVCLLLSLVIVPVSVNAVEATTEDTSTLGEYYKFTFGEDGDRFDYAVSTQKADDTTGQATYKDNTFYPLWVQSNSANAWPEYKTITTSDGKEIDVLEIKNTANVRLTPLTKDGKPFELIPGVKYYVTAKMYNPASNCWGQFAVSAGTSNNKDLTKVIGNSYKYDGTFKTADASNEMAGALAWNGGGIVGGSSYVVYLKDGSYSSESKQIALSSINKQYNEEGASTSRYVNAYLADTRTVFIDEKYSNGYDAEKQSYSTKFAVDGQEDAYLYGNNYLTLSFGGGNVMEYKDSASYPLFTNATKEELDELGTIPSCWQIESIEIVSETFKSSLSYSVNGEIVKVVDSEVGTALEIFIPEAPEGKYFAGWFTDEACTKAYAAETLEFGKNTVYAKFSDYGSSLRLDFNAGDYTASSTAFYYTPAGYKWPLTGYSFKDSYVSDQQKTEVIDNLEREGLSTDFPEGAVAFYSDRTWGQPGGVVFANPDGTLFVPEAGESYRITYRYRTPLHNGTNMAINVIYGLVNSMAGLTSTADKGYSKSILAWNTIEEANAEWTEVTKTVTIPAAGDDHIPALGLDITGVKKIAVEGGFDYTMVELDYVQVEKVITTTVTFVALDGTTSTAKVEVGAEIKYPALAASRDADVRWSLSADEYVEVPATATEPINIYAFASDVIGFENYYKADYAKYSLNLTVTDEVVFDGDKAMKYHNVGYQYQSAEPADWAENWTKYYEFDAEGNIVALGGEEAPVWAAGTYMTKRDGDEHSLALWTTPAGKSYRVSFKYYVPAQLGVDVTMSLYNNTYNLWNPVTNGKVSYPDSKFVIGADTETGKWLDGKIIFTATAAAGCDLLYARVLSSSSYTDDVVYFDNFVCEEVDYVGTVKYVNGATEKTALYESGDQIAYDALTAVRGADVVWSLDPDKYVPAPKTFEEDVTVYAIASDVIGFENHYQADYIKNCLNVLPSEDIAFTGDKSLKYENIGYTYTNAAPEKWATEWTKYYEIVDGEFVQLAGEEAPEWKANTYLEKRGNSTESSIALWNVPGGKAYKVSFKYFVPAELGVTVTMSPYTNSYNIWHSAALGKVEYNDSAFVIDTDTVAGEWLDGEIYFVSGAVNKGYDILYIHVGASENFTGELVYFDDFTLTEVNYATFEIPEDAVLEDGGIRNGNIVTVYAEAGEEIVAPLVVDAEGVIIEAWADANGRPVSEFVNGGAYKVAPEFIYGDCDNDGDVDTTDLAVLKLKLANLGEVGPGADCNASGAVDTTDLAVLKLYLAKLGGLGPEA